MLLLQPQAALHFATSEEHVAAAETAHTHHAPGHAEHHHPGSDHADHRDCDVCLLASSAGLPRTAASLTHLLVRPTKGVPAIALQIRAEKPLRPGDPARAPPRNV